MIKGILTCLAIALFTFGALWLATDTYMAECQRVDGTTYTVETVKGENGCSAGEKPLN